MIKKIFEGDNRKSPMNLVCPWCHIELSLVKQSYECNACRKRWIIHHNVILSPNFNNSQYWGEIPRISMNHLLWRGEILGPACAFEEWARDNGNLYMERYALDLNRAALCLELTGIPDKATILDYGCGYGTIGLAPFKYCERIYLVDSTFERIRFAKWRASEIGANNIIALAINNWNELPIPNGTLDIIFLNGVLEWIPTTAEGDAVDIQIKFLKKMKELLKPGGVLYIGIENRYALRYFGGYPDDHTNLLFTSIMPRKLADIYCKIRRKGAYRTITWSLREHRINLKNLGFMDPIIYCIYPNYRFPEAACRITDIFALAQLHRRRPKNKGIKERIRQIVEFWVTCFNLWPWLVYSYGIAARNPNGD